MQYYNITFLKIEENKMNNFKSQIMEDIKEYQSKYPYINNIRKDEWAFNFWILDKIFCEDEEIIESKIIEYHDMAIDAYSIHEETKDIYLIQNKYFSDDTQLSTEYIKNDFLIRGITALENGTYSRSEELQSAFNKYKDNSEFKVYLQLFVTNNKYNKEADVYIKEFNKAHPRYEAKIYYLDDIKELYYGDMKQEQKNIKVRVESINKGTILNINTEDYKLENVIDAKYVLTPVVSLYNLYKKSLKDKYSIFDMNIREYLGNKGVNKQIYSTLLDKNDRKNFFYYNNGVTIICSKMGKISTQASDYNMNVGFEIENPQIVNGCQTVNSIYQALNNMDPNELEREFKDCFVMLKILEINQSSEFTKLYKDIVKYNNSQNSIDEKTFAANKNEFIRLQEEFENKGFLLLIKQSDKHSYSEKYKSVSKLLKFNQDRIEKFGLHTPKKASDVFISLEKLLQVINAFVSGAYTTYTKKSSMLKFDSEQYNLCISFIKNSGVTIDTILDLYMLYKRAEQEKKSSEDDRNPIPYYLIDGFAKYDCSERNSNLISEKLSDSGKINKIVKLYTLVTKDYTREYLKKYTIDYNKMIKRQVDYELLNEAKERGKDALLAFFK